MRHTFEPRARSRAGCDWISGPQSDRRPAGSADFTDPNLVNGWGIAISAASPFWVCDGGTGLPPSTQPAPRPSRSARRRPVATRRPGRNTVCTGIVVNSGTTGFLIGPAPGRAPNFIFATRRRHHFRLGQRGDPLKAQMGVDNSAAAVYKGLAMVTTPPRSYTPPISRPGRSTCSTPTSNR